MFLEISQNSLENTCSRVSFLIKLQALGLKRDWHRCFPVNFAKFLRTPFLKSTSERLVLILPDLTEERFPFGFKLVGTQQKMRINPFVLSAPFLYPLKTSMFSGKEKGCIGNKWIKTFGKTIHKIYP